MTNHLKSKQYTVDEINEMPVLEAVSLSKTYSDGTEALKNVSIAVPRGNIYTLLGGNGAGKTTLMNLFLNFTEPTSGAAKILGFETHIDPLEAKKHIAFVSENVQLYPTFSAIQNVEFFCKISGKNQYSDEDYRRALTRVGLQKEAHDKKLGSFSKGMRQKTGIAIAILKGSPAILLDEPTSGLDPKAGVEFCHLLTELRDEGISILMSTHDIFRAREIADKVGILNNGKLVLERSKDELKNVDLQELYVTYMAGYMDEHETEEVAV